jgi:hypothetical protein
MKCKILIKAITIPFLTILFNISCFSQVVISEWIASKGTKGWDIVNDITCDATGNIYITGSFTDTLLKKGAAHAETNACRALYVAKYDTTGKMIWNKKIQQEGAGYGSLIGRGQHNELILIGGMKIPNKDASRPTKRYGFFISSLDTGGVVIWTQNITGSTFDYLTSMIVDTLGGEILITGSFHDTVLIGEKQVIAVGSSDGMFLRFDLYGNLKELAVIGGKGEDKLNSIITDSLHNRYITGTFQRKIQFDKKTAIELPAHQGYGVFLANYSIDGKVIAARTLVKGKKIRVDAICYFDNQIILAGSFSDLCTIGTQTLTSRGGEDIFMICVDRNLSLKWYRQIGGIRKDRASKLICMGNEIILSGSFNASISLGQKKLQSIGTGSDVFAIACDVSGNFNWIRSIGGMADDYTTCMTSFSKNYIYIAGSYRQQLTLSGKTIQSVGEEDVFMCRLENCHSLAPIFKKPECFCEGSLIKLDAGDEFDSYNWADGLSHERTFDVDRRGNYPLELVAGNGCIIYDTINVIDIPTPLINLGNDTTIADTARILLHVNDKFTRYLWNNGTTKPENLLKGIELKEGSNHIQVAATNDKGCIGRDEMVINMVRTMPNLISELVSGSCVIYPNPTIDKVTVYFTIPFKTLTLTLYDLMSNLVRMRTISDYTENAQLELDLGTLPKGLYTLQIQTDRGTASKKIVLQ